MNMQNSITSCGGVLVFLWVYVCLCLCFCVRVCMYRDEHFQTIRSKILCRAEYALLSEHRQLPLPIVNVAKMCSVRPLLTLYRLASSSSPPLLHLFSLSTPFLYLSPPLQPPPKGTCQKRFSGFCPLRGGGGVPPFPLSFFEHNDCLLRGGGIPPKSVKEKIR